MKFQTSDSRKIFWLLFIICAAARVYIYFRTYIIAMDSVLYMDMADLFLKGRFLEAIVYPPPLYPFLVAGMRLVIGDPEIAGKLVSLLAGICAFFPLYDLGKRFFDHKVVFLGLFLFAIHPLLVRYSAEVLSDSTFIFLSIAGFWMLWKGWEKKQYLLCALAGVILGLSCLTRAQGIIWIGAVLAVPIIFSFLKPENKINKRNLWISFLLAAFAFFLVILPYGYFLKTISGEWTIRQHSAWAILWGTGIPYDLDQSFWGTLIFLLSHPLLLVQKLGWSIGSLLLLLPEAVHYPFFLLLIVGLVARRDSKQHLLRNLYLAVICLGYIVSQFFLYFSVRYLLPIVPFVLFWAGQGFWVTVSWVQRFRVRYMPHLMTGNRALVTVFLICVTAASALPKTLEPQRLEKLDRKEIGHRIAALFQRRSVIITSEPRIGFYAKSKIVGLWGVGTPKIETFTKLLEYAHENHVDIIVMDKKLVNLEGEIGDLARNFFAHSNHPGLQLLFVYPPENQKKNQGKASIFYVYRLAGEKKVPK
jgi:4-amino-4-deoxy-L-arabinose transferase-like glycosyltransferase